jgi:hypothetical protein
MHRNHTHPLSIPPIHTISNGCTAYYSSTASNAPAGDAATAARRGCARMLVGFHPHPHPHLTRVGASNPIIARLGARRDKSGNCDFRNWQLLGSFDTDGFKKCYMYTTSAKISCSAHPINFLAIERSHILSREGGEGVICKKITRRLRTDNRSVGACGGESESNVREGRSVLVDHHVDVEMTQRGRVRQRQRGGVSRREGRRGLAAAILCISRRRKTIYGRFRIMFLPPRPFGSGNGDHALPYRHPLSLGTPNML